MMTDPSRPDVRVEPAARVAPDVPAGPAVSAVPSVPTARAVSSIPAEPAVVPPEVVAWVAAGREVLAVARHADTWHVGVRRAVLGELDRIERLLTAARGEVVTAEREAGTWSLRGDRDLAGFVGRESHQGRGAGLAAVGQASTLATMPAVAEALVDGPVTPKHVAEIARAVAASAALAAELATGEGQVTVVELARRLDGGQFGKALAQLSASLDPATRQRSHDEQRANRYLNLTHASSGTLLKGRLDSVAGHRLAKALDALCPRPALDDDRPREQRQADALMAMVDRVATDKTTTPGALAPVQAIVTFTEDTWTALRATHGHADEPVTAPGSATDVIARLRGLAPVTDETGQAWPASEVARALCDCALTWAVVGTPSAELNLGRESRLFRRQHWMALYAAGITGCAIGGCGMPLAYTELHHLRWWYEHDGSTDIANCLPYCSYHHHEIHRLGITVIRHRDGMIEHRYPDGRVYGAPPMAGDPPGPGRPSSDRTVAGSAGRQGSSGERARPGLDVDADGDPDPRRAGSRSPNAAPVHAGAVVGERACPGPDVDADGDPDPRRAGSRSPNAAPAHAGAAVRADAGCTGPPHAGSPLAAAARLSRQGALFVV